MCVCVCGWVGERELYINIYMYVCELYIYLKYIQVYDLS